MRALSRLAIVMLVAAAACVAVWTALLGPVRAQETPAPPAKENTTVKQDTSHWKTLTPEEEHVIVGKGTDSPFTGEYVDLTAPGLYTCRRCGAVLFRSQDKFHSGSGWPSFDDTISGAVTRQPDADGRRTEIICTNCGGHLGHVFLGEGMTPKSVRNCVNSTALTFVPEAEVRVGRAYFAGGCFWGVEHLLKQQSGVIATTVGYMGGHTDNPTYRDVCSHTTGHAEAVEVLYDPQRLDFEALAKLFFEIHDPTQANGQGPDLGDQYRSEIFTTTAEQQAVARKLIADLKARGMDVVTQVTPAGKFWPAEEDHQDYYDKTGKLPYCHARKQLW